MLCLSIGEQSLNKVLQTIETHAGVAKLFEVRLDYLEEDLAHEDLTKLLATGQRLIFTCRHAREGGKRSLPEKERIAILGACLEAGAYLVDLEWVSLKSYLKDHGRPPFPLERTLVSFHEFERTITTSRGRSLLRGMKEVGAQIVKVVCSGEKPEHGLSILSLIPYGQRLGMKTIAFGMGNSLTWTRIACLFLGAPFTYVSPAKEKAVAAGQLDLLAAKRVFEELALCGRSTE